MNFLRYENEILVWKSKFLTIYHRLIEKLSVLIRNQKRFLKVINMNKLKRVRKIKESHFNETKK